MDVGSDEWKAVIRDGGRQLGVSLNAAVLDQFALHAAELLRWNRRFNLTAITAPLDVAVKHYIDSVAPSAHIPSRGTLLDIGTGGGFPGIPLKILNPELDVTLVESSRKKASFLKHAARLLALKPLQVVEIRAEEIQLPQKNAGFDVIVSRALAPLDRFLTMALPLVARGGLLVAWKGKLAPAELDRGVRYLQEAAAIPATNVFVWPYRLPVFEETRNLVVVNLSRQPIPPIIRRIFPRK